MPVNIGDIGKAKYRPVCNKEKRKATEVLLSRHRQGRRRHRRIPSELGQSVPVCTSTHSNSKRSYKQTPRFNEHQTTIDSTLVASREWFPYLYHLSVGLPRLLPVKKDLLHQPHANLFHPQIHVLNLCVWTLSSDPSAIKDFQSRWLRWQPVAIKSQPQTHTKIDGNFTESGVEDREYPPPIPLS